jgi:monoamine oxidase
VNAGYARAMDDLVTRRQLVGAGAAAAATVGLRTTPARAAARRTRRADVCVVGGGLSGLAAARALVAADRKVVVLEARNRVGGRTWNASLGAGHITEIGGEFVGPTQDRILALARAVGVKTFPTYNTGSNVLIAGGVRSLYNAVPGLPNDADVQQAIFAALGLDPLAKQAGVSAPWKAKDARAWDAMTLDDWMRTAVTSPKGQAVFVGACQAIWGADPKELSLLYVLQYVAAAGNSTHPGTFLRLITTGGGAQERRFVGGSQVVSERVAERLAKRVVLRAPVRAIAQDGERVRVVAGGTIVEASQVILAVPPALAARLAYSPALPKGKAALLRALVPGSLTKAEAVYATPFWRAAGLSGQGVADIGPANTIFDNSPPDGSVGVLFGFVGGSSHAAWAALQADQRRAQVLQQLVAYTGDPQAGTPVDYIEQDWTKERWTRGCPVAHAAPGVLTKYGPWLRRRVGRLHFAGTETADYWLGYMDGAVRAGDRAARDVLAALRR